MDLLNPGNPRNKLSVEISKFSVEKNIKPEPISPITPSKT
jgi:hypothetical protein